MKKSTLIVFILFFTSFCQAQDYNIETESVSIENLITFVVEHFPTVTDTLSQNRNKVTFLIQTSQNPASTEDKVILKHAFKILSKRMTSKDSIAIICYSDLNGIALNETSSKDLKKILSTLNNLYSNITHTVKDGIELGYKYAQDNYSAEAINSVVIIRNPNLTLNNAITSELSATPEVQPKKKNNLVLLTAIALLPEIISIIKD